MKTLFDDLSLHELQKLFREEEDKLAHTLLSGVEWKSTVKERLLLTTIAAAIHKKVFPTEPFNFKQFKYYVKESELQDINPNVANPSTVYKSSMAILPKALFRSGLYAFNFLISLIFYCLMQISFFTYSTIRSLKRKTSSTTVGLVFAKGQLFYIEIKVFIGDMI